MEKGIAAARMSVPPEGVYGGVDLRVLPRYVCFRAAELRARATERQVIAVLVLLLLGSFAVSRIEVSGLQAKLRAKEYILAPGVQDFTPAAAQTVPDQYVKDAVYEYLSELGNVTSGNIEDQYRLLASSMSPALRVKFLTEADDFKARVKSQGVSEMLSVGNLEIRATDNGFYRAVALVRRDTYINNEYAGQAQEVVEMDLELVPPRAGRRWFLQINRLTRQSATAFSTKKGL
ncbi:MAG: hypothetical protein JST16_05260 [Bdellovibrionales bacterium]|nr:hypothetical protein [Bdellovibrionales bacterium]